MPRSAIASGCVDYELPPAEMPARLVAYAGSKLGSQRPAAALPAPSPDEAAMKAVFLDLRQRTGHDFSQYKPATIDRRVRRRMAVHQIDTLAGYVKYLQQTPLEVAALFRDLLIGVTGFFRDPPAFQALEAAIAKLFADKTDAASIRAWVPGCSTGEEAYSIAILLRERALATGHTGLLQVFGTDIDTQAIASARSGLFPARVAADIAPARLAACFSRDPDGSAFRAIQALRDMLVFSVQDLIRDPPFSKLDLISCRNLMIYMGAELQNRLLPIFHYALNPGGSLFLGSSETVGSFGELFDTTDRDARLYRRQAGAQPGPAGAPAEAARRQPARPSVPALPEQALPRHPTPVNARAKAEIDGPEPPERSGPDPGPAPTEASVSSIVMMAREGLRAALAAVEAAVSEDGTEMQCDARVAAPRLELHSKGDFLRASNEELRRSNESFQSVNEELQSTNEELETSKEELQSVNEELATVNAELQSKLSDLSRVNNDMNNLLAGTGIATVFVDSGLCLLRFTPSAAAVINLILSDIGRPIGHIVNNLVGYARLIADTQGVLDTLVPREITVQTVAGHWYTLRIQPYRTLDNVIEGAVLTFVDVTEIVRTRDALRDANELLRLAVVVRDAHDAITVQALDGRILAWNPGAVRMYGWTEAEALSMNVRERTPEALRAMALERVQQLSQAEVLEPYLTQRIAKGGGVLQVSMISTALIDKDGQMYAVATTERAATSRRAAGTEGPHVRPA
jgi:two-component system CheB/CheR fusion protein